MRQTGFLKLNPVDISSTINSVIAGLTLILILPLNIVLHNLTAHGLLSQNQLWSHHWKTAWERDLALNYSRRLCTAFSPIPWSSVSKWIILKHGWQSLWEDSSPLALTVNFNVLLDAFVTVASVLALWAVVTAITVAITVTVVPSLCLNINTCCLNVQRFYFRKVRFCSPYTSWLCVHACVFQSFNARKIKKDRIVSILSTYSCGVNDCQVVYHDMTLGWEWWRWSHLLLFTARFCLALIAECFPTLANGCGVSFLHLQTH